MPKQNHDHISIPEAALSAGLFNPNLPVRRFFAPGRVNLIGEHLDYNGGHVLPAAIGLGITGYFQIRTDGCLVCASSQFGGKVEAALTDTTCFDSSRGWANYPIGMAKYLIEAGYAKADGGTIYFDSNLPVGSGLSSSAAIEMITAIMLAGGSFATEEGRIRMARLAQTMENEFIGVRCGIMDQFAVAVSKQGHAVLLDTATLSYEFVPTLLEDCSLIIMNTNRPRALSDSKYNERRAECEAALAYIATAKPHVQSLAQSSSNDLTLIPEGDLRRRARHVITEEQRVHRAAEALKRGAVEEFGALLIESHLSLRDDYEVTGRELDTLVDASCAVSGCFGARMTGAGFGGCAIAVVRNEAVTRFIETVGRVYQDATGLKADFYITAPAAGARELRERER